MFRNFLLFPLLLLFAASHAQDDHVNDMDLIKRRLVSELRAEQKEQVLLSTNKKIYAAGETIWFKAYIVDSSTGRLMNRSKILYVDLVDEKDRVIRKRLLNTANAEQSGAITVDSLSSGYCWLRAYTDPMLDDPNSITVKPVYIIGGEKSIKNDFSSARDNQPAPDVKPLIDVYPEGGALIGGAECVVAVKANTPAGKGLPISGVIKDNKDAIVVKFSTNNEGLGKFSFTPSSYQTYKLCLVNNDKCDSISVLPRVNPYSGQIAITAQSPHNITARVLLEDSVYVKDYKTYIIGLHNDSICFAAVGKDMFEFNIPLSNFPAGVATLLLFSSSKELMSARDFYVSKNGPTVTVTTDQQNYAARDNVQMNIDLSDAAGKPMLATFSVSVTDSRVADTINNFYVDRLARLSAEEADLCMLAEQNETAQYWRHVYAGDSSSTPSPEGNLDINGMLVDRKEQPLSNSEVTLMPSGGNDAFFLQDTTDTRGKFSFPMAAFNNGTAFNLRVVNEHGIVNDYDVILDSLAFPQLKTPPALKQKFTSYQAHDIKKLETFYNDSVMNGNWLPPVKVSGIKNKKGTSSDVIITKDMITSGSNSLETALLRSGRFRLSQGYLISGGPNGFSASASDEPTLVLDGVQVPLANEATSETPSPILSYLKSFPASQIDHIRILTGPAAGLYGVRSGHGVIEIYTTPQFIDPVSSSTGLKAIYPRGFDTPPVFEMPDYLNKQVKNSHNADLRTAVYWNGNVVTDHDGKASVNFFTADLPAAYVVTISGVTIDGDRIFKTVTVYRNLNK